MHRDINIEAASCLMSDNIQKCYKHPEKDVFTPLPLSENISQKPEFKSLLGGDGKTIKIIDLGNAVGALTYMNYEPKDLIIITIYEEERDEAMILVPKENIVEHNLSNLYVTDYAYINPPFSGGKRGQKRIGKNTTKNVFKTTRYGVGCIAPPTWQNRNPEIFTGFKPLYIEVDVKTRYFPKVGSSIGLYYWKRTDEKMETVIISETGERFQIYLDGLFLPFNYLNPESIKVVQKIHYNEHRWSMNFKRENLKGQIIPPGHAFIRRNNRNDFYNCIITYAGFENDVNASEDYISDNNPELIESFLNSTHLKFYYKAAYETSPYILLGDINNLKIPDVFDGSEDSLMAAYNTTNSEMDMMLNFLKNKLWIKKKV